MSATSSDGISNGVIISTSGFLMRVSRVNFCKSEADFTADDN